MNKVFYIILGVLFAIIISLSSILVYRHLNDTKSIEEDSSLVTDSSEKEDNNTYEVTESDTSIDTNTSSVTSNDVTYSTVDSTSNDAQMINYFSSVRDELQGYANSDNATKLKEKGKEYFILICDFMFYDGAINGIYLSDVSDSTKEVLWNIFGQIDSIIVKVSPNYKEEVGAGYNKITDILKSGFATGKSKFKEIIGDENYNKAISGASTATEYGKSAISTAKEKISNWYQKLKE